AVLAREHAGGERAPADHAKALGVAGGKDLALDVAADEVVEVLRRDQRLVVPERGDAVGAGDLPGIEIGAAEIANLAGTDEVGGAQRFLDRGVGIGAVELVEVDVLDLEALEATLAGFDDVLAREAAGGDRRSGGEPAFAGDDEVVALVVLEGDAEHGLGGTGA